MISRTGLKSDQGYPAAGIELLHSLLTTQMKRSKGIKLMILDIYTI